MTEPRRGLRNLFGPAQSASPGPDLRDGAPANTADLQAALTRARGKLDHLRDALGTRTDQVHRLRKVNVELRDRARLTPYEAHLQRTIRFARGVVATLDNVEPELILAHDNLALLATNALRGPDTRVVYDAVEIPDMAERSGEAAHGFAEDTPGRRTIAAAEWPMIRGCDAITTVSPGLADWLISNFSPVPVTLVRNARNPASPGGDHRSIRDESGAGPDHRLIVYQNTPFAGADAAVHGLAELPPTYRLAFVGCDPETEVVQKLADLAVELGVSERVAFLGLFDADKLIPFVSGADVAIIPFAQDRLNLQFSLPNRLFEAVAAGLPLVVPTGGDVGRLVADEGLGVVYGTDLHPSIDSAVAAVFSEPADRFGASSRLTWDDEKTRLREVIGQPTGNGEVVLLANKPITNNDRIRRVCSCLLENGWTVTVAARTLPHHSVVVEDVTYHSIELT